MHVITNIPFKLNYQKLMKQLHIKKEGGYEDFLLHTVREAEKIANIKAVFKESTFQLLDKHRVVTDQIEFTSKALAHNLIKVDKIFPFIITCGSELDSLNSDNKDFLEEFIIDTIKGTLLNLGFEHLIDYISEKYDIKKAASINPGSGDTSYWPIEQQKELFSLFPNTESLIGVKLTENYLMIPNKSLSGVIFPTDFDFHNCTLCNRDKCPTRTKPFNKDLHDKFTGN